MTMKFPKPWTLERVDPMANYVVTDANGVKLFYVSADDNPDGEGAPGTVDGPTVLEYSDDDDELMEEIEKTFL
jgi:hypothetical protein